MFYVKTRLPSERIIIYQIVRAISSYFILLFSSDRTCRILRISNYTIDRFYFFPAESGIVISRFRPTRT
jgi:hypothetical protein